MAGPGFLLAVIVVAASVNRVGDPGELAVNRAGDLDAHSGRLVLSARTAVTRKLVGSRTQLRTRPWLPASNSLRYSRPRHHHWWLPAHGTDDRTAAARTHPRRSGHYRTRRTAALQACARTLLRLITRYPSTARPWSDNPTRVLSTPRIDHRLLAAGHNSSEIRQGGLRRSPLRTRRSLTRRFFWQPGLSVSPS